MSSNRTNSSQLSRPERIAKAADLLKITLDTAEQHSREVPGTSLAATYVWEPVRGGGALIVSEDGSVLFANSSVNPEAHEREFNAGRRTDESSFL